MEQKLIVVRGGGDLATGTIHRLWSAELPVLVLETEHPVAIRRQVSVSEAVYDGQAVVEDMTAVCISNCEKVWDVLAKRKVPVLVDPEGMSIQKLCPVVVVDAILAKKNLGTHRAMAPLTVALGPGFEAGRDVDVVIEAKRGHKLGRVIRSGSAAANTGIPGRIDGYAKERVMHATEQGVFHNIRKIGDIVEKGEPIGWIEKRDGGSVPVTATIPGLLRGLLREGCEIPVGFKIADIDPRKEEFKNCFTISDKARCIGGSVLEVIVPCFLHKYVQ